MKRSKLAPWPMTRRRLLSPLGVVLLGATLASPMALGAVLPSGSGGAPADATGPVLPEPAAPTVVWSTSLKQPVYSEPQARDGRLYITSTQPDGPNVFALDGQSGKLLWSFATDGSVSIPPTVGASQVFIASDVGETHFLRAIDARTGSLIWQYTRGQPPECMCSYPSTLSGGLLFAQTDGHSLYAFDPSGSAPSKRLWSFTGDGALLTAPVVADGVVVVGSSDRRIYGLDAKTGKTLWTGTTGYAFTAGPVASGRVVVIGDQGGNIDGFDLKTGKQLWSFTAGGAIDDAAVIRGNTAYVVSEDRTLYAISVDRGRVAWQHGMADYAEHPPELVGGMVIVDNRAGELLALDAATGRRLWQSDLGGTPFSAPIPWPASKAVVLKIGDHAVGAYAVATGHALWRYRSPDVVTRPLVHGADVDVATSAGHTVALR